MSLNTSSNWSEFACRFQPVKCIGSDGAPRVWLLILSGDNDEHMKETMFMEHMMWLLIVGGCWLIDSLDIMPVIPVARGGTKRSLNSEPKNALVTKLSS